MPLETANYVGNLVATNPAANDPKNLGDDHLRLIKSVLLNTFAGFAGMALATGVEAQGATASDYTVTVSPAPAAYSASAIILFKATHTNAGAATLQINTLGTKPLLDVDGNPLPAGAVTNGALCAVFYDGSSFYLISGNGLLTAPTPSVGDNSTRVATTAFVVQQAFLAALPGQTGSAGKYLTTDGTSASWVGIPATALYSHFNLGGM